MRKRSKAREYALQALYQADIRHVDAKEVLQSFWRDQDAIDEITSFANRLVVGTLAHLASVDGLIQKHTDNWDIKRMAVVDRNILRLGVYELLYQEDVPPSVCINESIELAKRFADAESAKFINGILDAVYKAQRASKTPKHAASGDGAKAQEANGIVSINPFAPEDKKTKKAT